MPDLVTLALAHIDNPLAYIMSPKERIYWFYLVTALGIALLVRARQGTRSFTLLGFLRDCFPRAVYLHESARVDYVFFVVSRLLFGLLFLPVLIAVEPHVGVWVASHLRVALPAVSGLVEPGLAWNALFAVVATLVVDLALFAAHYAQHRVPFLWEFHKVHHSAQVLTPLTVYRMHPVDDILSMILAGLLLGTGTGVFAFLTAGPIEAASIGGLGGGFFLFYLLGYNLRHSHLWVSYGPVWSRVFISPAQHQIHHSKAERHHDRNLGLLFAFWDGIFGTLYVPQEQEPLEFGLGGDEDRAYSSTARLFVLPLRNLYREHRGVAVTAALVLGLLSIQSVDVIAAESAPGTVRLEELTWEEVAQKVQAGTTTVLVPTGGTEQNGPHVVLGKHNYIVRYTSEQIAHRLGNTLVAPTLPYVPQSATHMRFPGTLTIPEETFEAILEHTARSLEAHGFRTICFVGDSGDNQAGQARVAARLDREWRAKGIRVLHVSDYYAANGQHQWLAAREESTPSIGAHAGIRDTSELLFVHPAGVRSNQLPRAVHNARLGVSGDPTRASAQRGRALLDLKIEAAAKQIEALSDS